MYQEDRLRRLGDRIKGKWQRPVIDGGPRWSGNTPVKDERTLTGPDKGAPPRQVITPLTVHALLLLYDKDAAAVDAWADGGRDGAGASQREDRPPARARPAARRERCRPASISASPTACRSRFRSAPSGGKDDTVVLSNGQPAPRDPWHGVPLGEILLGHTNAHAEKSPGPLVPDDLTGAHRGSDAARRAGGLLQLWSQRQLHGGARAPSICRPVLEIPARTTPQEFAPTIRPRRTSRPTGWPNASSAATSTATAVPGRAASAGRLQFPAERLRLAATDAHGHGCPVGAHVRRANPRDGLAKDPASAQTLLDAANNHRILRRGRKYGPPPTDRHTDDGAERGLLFICLNADIARQFEFVQQTWILNSNFATLYDETDPLVGTERRLHHRRAAVAPDRRGRDLHPVAGGEYFFLPSLPALKYLASL